MKMHMSVLASAALLAATSMSHAALDGVLNGGVPLLSTQANSTGFGDNGTTDGVNANGSELDAAYGQIDVANHKLYLMLTGNLENNYNKLDLFIQTHSGGANVVPAGLNNQGGLGFFSGTKFDAGFAPTSIFSLGAGGPNNLYVDYVDIVANSGQYLGTTTLGGPDALSGGSGGIPSLRVGINNSNVGGVTSAAAIAAAAQAVTTGIEITIDLNDLGWDGGPVNIAALINGSGNNYLSNQMLGSLPFGTGNLAGSPADYTTLDGDQFFTVPVPEPVSAAPLGLMAVGVLGRRRR